MKFTPEQNKRFDEKFIQYSSRGALKVIKRNEFGEIYEMHVAREFDIKQHMTEEIERAVEERTKIILNFLDELEVKQPEDLKTDNWRNWKYIRNSIVDRFLNPNEEAE